MNSENRTASDSEVQSSLSDVWRRLPISRQVLIAVNCVLMAVAGTLLLLDYRHRINYELSQKQIALSEEAKTIYESLLAVELDGDGAIQSLVDNICARMNSHDSPGHHIAAEWRGREFQAVSHGQASSEMLAAMRFASEGTSKSQEMSKLIVVGSFSGQFGSVFVSEQRTSVLAEARRSLLLHVIGGLGIAALAAVVVNTVLQRVISAPMKGMVSSLRRVAGGDLNVVADERSCRELSFLTDQINAMALALSDAARDRRMHMEKARQIQQHLLPTESEWNGLRIASIFEPAEDVGGDYFDVISISDHEYLVCVADVTGHGVPAAMAAAMLKTLTQQATKTSPWPKDVLASVNREYTRIILPGHLATMAVVLIDTEARRVTYANAGQEPPLLQFPDGEIQALETTDLLLGVDTDESYREQSVDVPDGGKVILLSDGVTEAFDPDDKQYGIARVVASIKRSQDATASEAVAKLSEDLKMFRRSRAAFDDTTLVVAEVLGERRQESSVAHKSA